MKTLNRWLEKSRHSLLTSNLSTVGTKLPNLLSYLLLLILLPYQQSMLKRSFSVTTTFRRTIKKPISYGRTIQSPKDVLNDPKIKVDTLMLMLWRNASNLPDVFHCLLQRVGSLKQFVSIFSISCHLLRKLQITFRGMILFWSGTTWSNTLSLKVPLYWTNFVWFCFK